MSVNQEAAVVSILERSGWRVKRSADNLSIGCPLAAYSPLHKSTVDSRPSMGIKVQEGAVLVHCFTCGFKAGQLSFLFKRLARHDVYWQPAVSACLEMENAYVSDGIEALSEQGYFHSAVKKQEGPLDEELWAPYGRVFNNYFAERGITFETGKAWGVGYDADRSRVLVPVRDQANRLWGAVGRTTKGEIPKYLNYFDMAKGKHLLGAHMIGRAKSIVVVEGALDAMLAYQAIREAELQDEYACVALMGASMSDDQVRRLVMCAHEVILAFDADEAGSRGQQAALGKLGRLIMTKVADFQGQVGKKDFGDCTSEEILKVIKNSQLPLG